MLSPEDSIDLWHHGPTAPVCYCPVCGRSIVAENAAEIEAGEDTCAIFTHDEVPHSECDIYALSNGIQ